MDHIGIDLGGKESQICVRKSDGTIREQKRVATGLLSDTLRRRKKARVVLETSSEAFAIADAAIEAGHEVRVVPATIVRSLGVGLHGVKTDKRDAQAMSEVSCRIDLPSVHIPSPTSRQWRAICGTRDALVKSRTLLVNNVRGWLRGQVIRLRTGGTESFAKRVRERILEVPPHIERQLVAIEQLTVQICSATKDVTELAKNSEVCQRLMTVPGIGPITAVRYVAALDNICRFKTAHQVESYLGLTPGEDSSSERRRITSITKAGAASVRWLLVEAAWTIMRTRPFDPISLWGKAVSERRGRRIGAVAVARKLAGILFAIWRDEVNYNPGRAANAKEDVKVKDYKLKK